MIKLSGDYTKSVPIRREMQSVQRPTTIAAKKDEGLTKDVIPNFRSHTEAQIRRLVVVLHVMLLHVAQMLL